MTTEEIAALKLSPAMRQALMRTNPGEPMRPGPTRAALMRRGLVWKDRETIPTAWGTLTPKGAEVREALGREAGLPW
jgi:hypothetical protein